VGGGGGEVVGCMSGRGEGLRFGGWGSPSEWAMNELRRKRGGKWIGGAHGGRW
jgi:hypothetical protein